MPDRVQTNPGSRQDLDGVTLLDIRHKDTKITTAQLLALHATPISLVAAPGAGKFLMFLGALAFLKYGTVPYDGIASGEDLGVKYTDASGALVATIETTGFLDASANALRQVGSMNAIAAANLIPVANAALVANLLVGEIATGDSDLYMRVYYSIQPSAFPA